jgi:hypothetical protein
MEKLLEWVPLHASLIVEELVSRVLIQGHTYGNTIAVTPPDMVIHIKIREDGFDRTPTHWY